MSVSRQSAFGPVPSATSRKQSYFPIFHYLTVQNGWRKVTVTGKQGTQVSKRISKWERETKKSIKTTFPSEECVCLGGNMHPVQNRCRRKARGKMARDQHSFSSGAQPTHAQIDPSWITEKGWVARRGEPGENSLLLFLHGFWNAPSLLNHTFLFTLYTQLKDFKNLAAEYIPITHRVYIHTLQQRSCLPF